MKNYIKILEAVNRGIKFALDDFEDQEEIQGQVNSKVKYKGGIKEYLEPFVDLGLPSGTLWCKCNLGANTETDYGDYYAWGELTTKSEYTWDSYTYNGEPEKLSSKHDVAKQKLGKKYSIPTKEQFYELLEYTNYKWVENYDGTGVNGQLFVSKINDNSLFIPAAGYYIYDDLSSDGSRGCVWTSSISTDSPDNCAWSFGFHNSNADVWCDDRYNGQSIRPVINL